MIILIDSHGGCLSSYLTRCQTCKVKKNSASDPMNNTSGMLEMLGSLTGSHVPSHEPNEDPEQRFSMRKKSFIPGTQLLHHEAHAKIPVEPFF